MNWMTCKECQRARSQGFSICDGCAGAILEGGDANCSTDANAAASRPTPATVAGASHEEGPRISEEHAGVKVGAEEGLREENERLRKALRSLLVVSGREIGVKSATAASIDWPAIRAALAASEPEPSA